MSRSFQELGLSEEVLKGVTQAGFEDPTPIQGQAIPILLTGVDLVAQAQTGTGKTAAFGLPMLNRLDPDQQAPQFLVMCPTRELAIQVSEAIYALGRPLGCKVLPIYGGQPIDRQLRSLRMGVQIVVGTPGRMLDHLRRGSLDLGSVKMAILDEADEMLDMGFVEDIELILSELPTERQIALFSATIPSAIAKLANKYLKNPKRIVIAEEKHTTPQIRQSYYQVAPAQKVDALSRILDMETPGPTIIFCRTRKDCDELGEHLRGRGYQAESLHGEMSQTERDRVMKRFRAGQSDLLVATDVAARGLDIETVTHVINYDIPWDVESYTHRIGRTGRAGREGDAITLVSPRERRQLKLIEAATGSRITPVRLPTTADIVSRRRELFKQSIAEALDSGQFEEFLVTVEELQDQYEPSEIAAAALKLLWKQNNNEVSAQALDSSDGARAEDGMVRLFITAGRQEGLRPNDLVGAIANEAGLPGKSIGAIDILDHCSFVEVPTESADEVVRALNHASIRGRKVKVQKARPDHGDVLSGESPRDQGRRPAGDGKGRSRNPGGSGKPYRTASRDRRPGG